jgi:hypothetical protein
MPRKHRSARERPGPPEPVQGRLDAPVWALVPWADVRAVVGDKPYRCPGCDHEIAPGIPHLVCWPADDHGSVADRRHWHRGCWTGRHRRGPTSRRW